MVGTFKEQLNDELVKSATNAYHKEICESLGISMEDVDFRDGGNRMFCTLTSEQIMTAAESDWLSRPIELKEEFVSAEDLGYSTEPAIATTTTKTTATETTTTDTGNNGRDETTLPQTGYSSINQVIAGVASLMIVTGAALVVKSRKENE